MVFVGRRNRHQIEIQSRPQSKAQSTQRKAQLPGHIARHEEDRLGIIEATTTAVADQSYRPRISPVGMCCGSFRFRSSV